MNCPVTLKILRAQYILIISPTVDSYCNQSYRVLLKYPYETIICLLFSWLHCKDHLKSQYNFVYKIFVTSFLVEMFSFIGYETIQRATSHCIITFEKD